MHNNQHLSTYIQTKLNEIKPNGIMNPFNDIKREVYLDLLEFIKNESKLQQR